MRVILTLVLATSISANAQFVGDFFVTANTNVYQPFSSGKRPIALVGVEKNPTTVVVGGFGIGGCTWITLRGDRLVKLQANVSRQVYWDEPLRLRDISNRDMGAYKTFSKDFFLGSSATLKYDLNESWSWGPGLGLQTLITSTLYVTNDELISGKDRQLMRNRHYKMMMPTFPVELTWHNEGVFLNVRYEQALLNRTARALGRHVKESYGLFFIEFGAKL
jgi:hypothetical protein